MCEFCEKMKPIMRTTFEDGTYLQATLCPISFKGKGPYIYIEHTTPIDEHYKTSYADGMFINYCPMCGKELWNYEMGEYCEKLINLPEADEDESSFFGTYRP